VKITLLGTGTSQGVPVIACECDVCLSNDRRDKRLRASVLIESKEKTIVIDAGPDFRYQMLRAHVTNLDALLLTHEHRDHIGGLDDVRAFNFKRKCPMDIYAEKWVLDRVMHELDYAFEENKYPGVPAINCHEISTDAFTIGSQLIQPIRVKHHLLPVLGFRFDCFAYITDANYIPESEFSKLKDLEVLVINSLRQEPHISHFSLPQTLEAIERIQPKRAILTHISHQMGLHATASECLPKGVELGVDGMQLRL
jgi:phosphoribosyl 1,2-cyclic phosphate phosphodiesterase